MKTFECSVCSYFILFLITVVASLPRSHAQCDVYGCLSGDACPNPDHFCYCDEMCEIFNDCCPDAFVICGRTGGSFECPEYIPSGACCLTDGTCQSLTAEDCASAGGIYQGDDTECPIWYRDMDQDGFGDPNSAIFACEQLTGYVNNSDDCNDSDQAITIIGTVCDDGNPFTTGDYLHEDCSCLGDQAIPTISQWGFIILGLVLAIIGMIGIKQKNLTLSKKR